jgi:membrane associated rhomboid family serine protease
LIDPVAIATAHGRRALDERALVLMAVGIPCEVVPAGGGMALLVAAEDAERASTHLRAYDAENASPPEPALRPTHEGLDAAIAYCAILLFFFAIDQRHALDIDWSATGAANAGQMRAGEWWQAITALCLHAGVEHLLGNLVFGVLFGLMATPVLGSGLAWLATLLAGGLGNAVNALLQPADHTAVGASTALFGTVGILATHAWLARPVPWRGGLRRFAPLGGGVLLLAFLGFGDKNVDIAAHVLGFLVGGAIGVGIFLAGARIPRGRTAQRIYGVAAVLILGLAWAMALLA